VCGALELPAWRPVASQTTKLAGRDGIPLRDELDLELPLTGWPD